MNDTTISRCRVVDQRYRPAVPGSARGANHLLAVALDHLTPSPVARPPICRVIGGPGGPAKIKRNQLATGSVSQRSSVNVLVFWRNRRYPNDRSFEHSLEPGARLANLRYQMLSAQFHVEKHIAGW